MGATGLGSVLAGCESRKESEPNAVDVDAPATEQEPLNYTHVPKRKLGKTGTEVPCLCLGGNQDLIANQIVLRNAPKWGVYYWDTSYNYAGGNSELGIGKILSKDPKAREKLFITSKASGATTADEVEQRLQTSLKRMNTDYIDLYYGYHKCANSFFLTNELKEWAESAKKRKLIR
ncbi:MAG: aldo/keto reductase, partial [Planctomycetota bacterium]